MEAENETGVMEYGIDDEGILAARLLVTTLFLVLAWRELIARRRNNGNQISLTFLIMISLPSCVRFSQFSPKPDKINKAPFPLALI